MKKQNNIEVIDYVKGVSIILVFIGHALTPTFLERPYNYELIVQAIYSFHMALFFLTSGFLSYKIFDIKSAKEYWRYIKNKFIRLGIPFITISFITNSLMIILKYLLNSKISTKELVDMITTIFLYPENGVMGALWFLYTLLIVSAIAPLIVKIPFKITILVALALNIFVPKYQNFISVSRVSFFLIYFLIGILLRKYYISNKVKLENISLTKKLFISIISSISIVGYSYIMVNQIYISKHIINILNLLCGFFGMALILIISETINKTKVYKKIAYLGNYSLDIYIFSWFFQIVSMVLITRILKIYDYNLFFISNIIIGSLCLPFSLGIIRRVKIFKFLFLGEMSKIDRAFKVIPIMKIGFR